MYFLMQKYIKQIHKKFGSYNGFLTQSMHHNEDTQKNQIDHYDETETSTLALT